MKRKVEAAVEEMPFHRKYRPQTFEEFKGNELLVKGILGALALGNQHSFLITGPTGSGKTTLARLIAKSLGCADSEFYEMNTANTRGIDTIREMIDASEYEPLLGTIKVILLDECHQITGTAAEALLKFLEDTPKHVYIIMCTTNPEKLLATVKNRCSSWTVSLLKDKDMTGLIDWVLENEDKTIPGGVKRSIVSVSEGCARQALVLLEKIINVEGEASQLQIIAEDVVNEVEIRDICSRIKNRGSWSDKEVAGMKQPGLCHMLEAVEKDPETVRRALLGWFAKVLLNARDNREAARTVAIMDIFNESFFYTGKPGLIKAVWKALQIP